MKTKFSWSWFLYIFLCVLAVAMLVLLLTEKRLEVLAPRVNFLVPETVKPDSEIQVSFSRPVKPDSVESSFKVTPEIKGKIIWSRPGRSFSFVPEEVMLPGQKYVLAFQGQTRFWIPFRAQQEIRVERSPKVERVSPFEGQGVGQDAKIFVKFNRPMDQYQVEFKLDPAVEFDVTSDAEKREFVLVPRDGLAGNQTYMVEVYSRYATNKEGITAEKVKDFSFSTLEPLQLITSFPQNGKQDIYVGQRVTLGFNKSIDLESFRQALKVEPTALYNLNLSQNGRTVVIQPDRFSPDTDYKITIPRGIRGTDGSYLETDQVVYFKTGNAGGVVKDDRRSTEDPMIKDGKYIDINLTSQLLGIYSDGVHLGTFRVSSGKSGMRTPTGQYNVMTKERRHWSIKYKLWMPFSLQFTGAGHFIHELPEWPSGYKEGASHLGIPVSHGCVRLGVGPAETVFNFAELGTQIFIHY